MPALATAVPFVFLAIIYDSLPDKVPMHWDINGEITRYGDKSELWILPFALPLLTYLIFLLVPYIDPKKQINEMGNKYHHLKLTIVLFMSILASYLIYATKVESMGGMKLLFIGIGFIISVLGLFLPSIKPNYFIGVRTPWTLENDRVWKSTHQLAGVIWTISGLLLAIIAFWINKSYFFWTFMGLIMVIALLPILYSFLKFKELDGQGL